MEEYKKKNKKQKNTFFDENVKIEYIQFLFCGKMKRPLIWWKNIYLLFYWEEFMKVNKLF